VRLAPSTARLFFPILLVGVSGAPFLIAKAALRESSLPYALETSGVSQDDSTWFASFLADDGTLRQVTINTDDFPSGCALDDGAMSGPLRAAIIR
jgi:hypothetical protein